jgi:hypothetical protein
MNQTERLSTQIFSLTIPFFPSISNNRGPCHSLYYLILNAQNLGEIQTASDPVSMITFTVNLPFQSTQFGEN